MTERRPQAVDFDARVARRCVVGLLVALAGHVVGCRARERPMTIAADDARPSQPNCTAALPEVVVRPTVLEAGCRARIERGVRIDRGASLRIEAGVTLELGERAEINVGRGGLLLVAGTEGRPVTFRGVPATTGNARWRGIVFDAIIKGDSDYIPGGASQPSTLEHVVIADAGTAAVEDAGIAAFPALLVRAGPLTIAHVTIRNHAGSGLTVNHDEPMTTLTSIRVAASGRTAAQLPLDVLAHASDVHFDGRLEIGGRLTTALKLPARVYDVIESIYIWPRENTPTLTIERGAVLRFARDAKVTISETSNGSARLHATGVTFTSAADDSGPNGWRGFAFMGPGEVTLRGCVIRHAGLLRSGGSAGKPAFVVAGTQNDEKQLRIADTVFEANGGEAINVPYSCASFVDPARGNVSRGHPLCVTR